LKPGAKPVYGGLWKKRKAEMLKLGRGYCQRCGSKKRLIVHHIIPLKFFTDHECAHHPNNLRILCISCHEWVHHKESPYGTSSGQMVISLKE